MQCEDINIYSLARTGINRNCHTEIIKEKFMPPRPIEAILREPVRLSKHSSTSKARPTEGRA
jgi:hypothetical protein